MKKDLLYFINQLAGCQLILITQSLKRKIYYIISAFLCSRYIDYYVNNQKKGKNMYTRTHVFKFVNKVSRDSFKFFCINYTDSLFKDGLNFSLFIDVSDISFQFLTVWKSKKEWEKSYQKAGEYSDLKKQITEMGATMTIVGGETQGRMSTESDFNLFENVK